MNFFKTLKSNFYCSVIFTYLEGKNFLICVLEYHVTLLLILVPIVTTLKTLYISIIE